MKSLNQILLDAKKGNVIKIYYGKGKSYTGLLVALNKRYFSLTGFGDEKNEPRYRVNLNKPEFKGRKVRGYERFIPEGKPRVRIKEEPLQFRTGDELTDRDLLSSSFHPFSSLSDDLDEDEKRIAREERQRRREEVESFDKSILSRDY